MSQHSDYFKRIFGSFTRHSHASQINRLNLTTKFFLTYTTFKSSHAATEWNSKARQCTCSTRAVSTTTKTVRLSHSKRH